MSEEDAMRHYPMTIGIITCLISIAGMAGADDKAEAKKHFKNGTALQKAEDFEAAVAEYERSVDYYASESNLYNLANCYRALRRTEDANKTFERILKEFGDELEQATREDIETQIKALKAERPKLMISTVPEGASVKVDGEDVGVTPLAEPLILPPGERADRRSERAAPARPDPLLLPAGRRVRLDPFDHGRHGPAIRTHQLP